MQEYFVEKGEGQNQLCNTENKKCFSTYLVIRYIPLSNNPNIKSFQSDFIKETQGVI